MTSTLKINTIEPEGATTTLTVGEAGQDTVIAGAGIKANVLKDAGGNALFTSDGSGSYIRCEFRILCWYSCHYCHPRQLQEHLL